MCFRADSREKNERSHWSHCMKERENALSKDWINRWNEFVPTLFVFNFWWIFRLCFCLFDAVENRIGQKLHWNGFTLVCVRSWILKFALVDALYGQRAHLNPLTCFEKIDRVEFMYKTNCSHIWSPLNVWHDGYLLRSRCERLFRMSGSIERQKDLYLVQWINENDLSVPRTHRAVRLYVNACERLTSVWL